MNTRTAYKVRHPKSGLYSTGGTSPRWNTKGKVWNNKGALSNHLKLVNDRTAYGEDCEVVTIEITMVETSSTPLSALLQAKKDAATKKDDARKAAALKAQEAIDLETLARLKKLYPGA